VVVFEPLQVGLEAGRYGYIHVPSPSGQLGRGASVFVLVVFAHPAIIFAKGVDVMCDRGGFVDRVTKVALRERGNVERVLLCELLHEVGVPYAAAVGTVVVWGVLRRVRRVFEEEQW
jgi:hypothetical protein